MSRSKIRTIQTEEPAPCKIWPGPKVDYNPGYCPNCGSSRNRIVATRECIRLLDGGSVTREHECYNCRTHFLSAQSVPKKDIEFYRETR